MGAADLCVRLDRYRAMVAKPKAPPSPSVQARMLRDLAERVERSGESLPADVLEAVERAALLEEGAQMWAALSPDEQRVVDELAIMDLEDLRKAGGG